MFTALVPNCSSIDMSVKKKLYTVLILAFVCILYYCSFGNRDEHFVSMKQSMDEYELLLRETREQILDRLKMCQRDCQHWDPDAPVIYVITPTYTRTVQKAELTRLSQTLMLVNNLHWIVIEDAAKKTILVENLLARTTLNYTHLIAQTPPKHKKKGSRVKFGPKGVLMLIGIDPNQSRGVVQRNEGLKWLRKNRSEKDKGVVYFADDDNSYNIQIFEEMRSTKEVSVWPVGLVGGLLVERPLLNTTTGKVVGWNAVWRPDRAFPIDMAGFAVNLGLIIRKSNAQFSYNAFGGFLESHLLEQLTTQDRLEPKAENCTQVLVWHTRTEAPKLNEENKIKLRGLRSDAGMEV